MFAPLRCIWLLDLLWVFTGKPPVRIQLKDSLKIDKQSSFLYNPLTIQNLTAQPIELILHASVPQGWRLMSPGPGDTLRIAAGAVHKSTIVLLKERDAMAMWLPVRLTAITSGGIKITQRFQVIAEAVCEFSTAFLTPQIELAGTERKLSIRVRVNNMGTTLGKYAATYKSSDLGIDKVADFRLQPGKDTILTWEYLLSERQWIALTRGKIAVSLEDTTGVSYMNFTEVKKVQQVLKSRSSPYPVLPIQVETGMMQWGRQFSYYAAARGEIEIGNGRAGFYYHSKQYGLGNRLERNVFGAYLKTKRWELYGGHLSSLKYFFSYGNGVKVTYTSDKNATFLFSTSIHSNRLPFTNDHVLASIQYPVGKIIFSHTAAANLDNENGVKSYLLDNEITLLNAVPIHLSVNLGAGQDVYDEAPPSRKRTAPGPAVGYKFMFTGRKLSISSQVQYNGKNFPGLNKGLVTHFHDLSWTFNTRNAAGLFWQYNRAGISTLRDTMFNKDALKFDILRYGVKYSLSAGRGAYGISIGRLRQTDGFINSLPVYGFLEFSGRLAVWKNSSMTFSSMSGLNNNYQRTGEDIFFTNTSFSMVFKNFGIRGFYAQVPVFDNTTAKGFVRYNRTLLAGPSASFQLFGRVKANLHYSISKTLYDKQVYHLWGSNMSYRNSRSGLDISASVEFPLVSGSTAPAGVNDQYINLSLSKRLNVPIIFRKKYYTLKLVPFFDKNGNGKLEPSENVIPGALFSIGDISFISGANGTIYYKNIPAGNYTIVCQYANKIKGWVPAGGFTQQLTVAGDVTHLLPFRKSKLITGMVELKTNALTGSRITKENIKVSATDSAGIVYTTMTNDNGVFFLNVPAGKYVVSLNPQAFSEKVRPKTMYFIVELVSAEQAEVVFEIVDVSREVRFFKN
ncbi:carboxypeptidase-like regulatory domain-containing protein [Chitinophaga pollutisoli]|uniref:Carboxypeptidase-like regulatory domain-containing protein n=1 Tax=Chitinophaga pollutisoli TaxID=3133966 RepID=A0ABZ2YNE5_9BACT